MTRWLYLDPALRSLTRRLPIVIAIALTFVGVLTNLGVYMIASGRVSEATPPGPGLVAGLLWVMLLVYLVMLDSRTRCAEVTLALPIPFRELWLTHGLALLLGGGGLLLVFGGLVGLGNYLTGRWAGEILMTLRQLAAEIGAAGSTYVLAVTLLQSREPALRKVRFGRMPAILAVSTAALVAALAAARISPWLALLPLVVAVAVGYRTLATLPSSFVVASSRPLPSDPAAAREESAVLEIDGRARPLSTWNTIHRILHRGSALRWMVVLFVLPMGVVLAGVYSALTGGSDIRWMHVALTAYILFAFFAGPMSHMHLIDALPTSRRRVFALLVVPPLLALSAGYGVGRVIVSRHQRSTEAIEWAERRGEVRLGVPMHFAEIASNGLAPDVESPWGETHEASSVSILSFSPAVVYSPFTVSGDSSAEFAALQVSRAAERVYGVSFPPQEILERYIDVHEDGTWAPAAGGLTLLQDNPGLRRRSSGPVFPVLMLPVIVLYAAALAFWLRSYRASVREGTRRIVFGITLAVLLLLHISGFGMDILGVYDLDAGFGAVSILIRQLGANPFAEVAVWVVCAAIAYGAYRLAESGFVRAEIGSRQGDLWFPLLSRKGHV